MAIERYRKKPEKQEQSLQHAAKYTPGGDLTDLLTVARMCDSKATLAEAQLPHITVLVVRYLHAWDDRPFTVDYEVIEPGKYLAYSEGNDFLYDTDDEGWRHWYDKVED